MYIVGWYFQQYIAQKVPINLNKSCDLYYGIKIRYNFINFCFV